MRGSADISLFVVAELGAARLQIPVALDLSSKKWPRTLCRWWQLATLRQTSISAVFSASGASHRLSLIIFRCDCLKSDAQSAGESHELLPP